MFYIYSFLREKRKKKKEIEIIRIIIIIINGYKCVGLRLFKEIKEKKTIFFSKKTVGVFTLQRVLYR